MERSRKFLLRPFHCKEKNETVTVISIGSKGIPAKYGGFETFVEKLTECQQDREIQYYVACMRENSAKSGITADTFEHNGAICYNIDVPNIGPARAMLMISQHLIRRLRSQRKTRTRHQSSMSWLAGLVPLFLGLKKKNQGYRWDTYGQSRWS